MTKENKNYYDKMSKCLKLLKGGEHVRIQENTLWNPAVVKEQHSDCSYIVTMSDKGQYVRNRCHLMKTPETPCSIEIILQ